MQVLLAEPSGVGRRILTTMLEQQGHRVTCAGDGAQAVTLLHEDPALDVVMTALELPTLSGLELCWEARLLASRQRPLYIIAISSSHDERKLVEALDSGADDFLNKPPRQSELGARLRAADRLITAQRELLHLASYDVLTGLRNRRSFFEVFADAFWTGSEISLIAFDIDHFKRINDGYGHDVGDDVLREVGVRCRSFGNVVRLGGEEFALLVEGDLSAASEQAEKLRCMIAEKAFSTSAGRLRVTASFGVARREKGQSMEALLKNADQAVYASKAAGRNQVSIWKTSLGAVSAI